MTDFETMPVGTAALLGELAAHLRAEHLVQAKEHEVATEKLACANGRAQEDAFREDQTRAQQSADRLAEWIGRVEALLDRSHAAGADR